MVPRDGPIRPERIETPEGWALAGAHGWAERGHCESNLYLDCNYLVFYCAIQKYKATKIQILKLGEKT
jgi:hypothetical protein